MTTPTDPRNPAWDSAQDPSTGPGREPAPEASPEAIAASPRALAEHLDRARITGEVATAREDNLAHIGGFLDRDPDLEFGVEPTRDWSWEEVFRLMVDRVGIDPDPGHLRGQDTIGVRQCLEALDRYRRIFSRTVREGGKILFATGHPAGLFPVYRRMAETARARGAQVLGIQEGLAHDDGDVRQIADVVMFQRYGALAHTHRPQAMRLVLDQLAAGGVVPDLVVADHGWAGAAASRGVPTVGIADCNDPGLFVSEAQGQLLVAVPMDDNVLPHLYEPLIAYLCTASED